MKKVLLIYNPYSGNNDLKNNLDYLFDAFSNENQELTVIRLKKDKDFKSQIKINTLNKYKKIVISGGDGTISSIINILLISEINIPIAIIPSGTSNDIARSLNYPNSIKTNINTATKFTTKLIDIPSVNNTFFINIFTVGDFAKLSTDINPSQKKLFGKNAYFFKGFELLSKISNYHVKITSKNFKFDGEIFLVIIINGSSVGGLNKISPNSKIDDGLLDVIIFKKMPAVEFPGLFLSVLNGKHLKNKYLISLQAKKIKIASKDNVKTDIDGEKGPNLPVTIEANFNNLKIIQ